ncbi:hypothetical protein LCM00_02865 [Bacillus infantis]|uniref:hypothetical protein n=1 Tax=Bacillus infantis TaxID=324767 RepID=UPI001CD63F4F|nr:hypothetical protein [Bacillus infantis]MCA1038440.1 hypothetical protein [Bacillus infantis]
MHKQEKQAGVPAERGQNTLLDTVDQTFNSMIEDVRNMISEMTSDPAESDKRLQGRLFAFRHRIDEER